MITPKHFELWDTQTRNLIEDFGTLDEAVSTSRQLVALNQGHYPKHLALAQVNEDGSTTWLATGPALLSMFDSGPDAATRRAG